MAEVYRGLMLRLDPNNAQAGFFEGCAGASRKAYNFAVAKIIENQEAYTVAKAAGHTGRLLPKPLSGRDVQNMWVSEREVVAPWYSQYPAHVYLFALQQAHAASRSWMKKRTGFPKFKSRRDNKNTAFKVCTNIKLKERHLFLPKVGAVRIASPDPRQRELRRLLQRKRARILSVKVHRDAVGNWWASLTIERTVSYQPPETDSPTGLVVGVDLGVKSLAVAATSDGVVVLDTGSSTSDKLASKRIQRAHREVSRKDREFGKSEKGRARKSPSRKRAKAKEKLARAYRRQRWAREDRAHKLTRTLADMKSVVVLEDLNVSGLMRKGKSFKKGLNRRLGQAALSTIRYQCEYKLGEGQLIMADRWYASSKICSSCGLKNTTLKLATRSWTCACGSVHDRDINAATNLAAWGERHLASIQAGDPKCSGPSGALPQAHHGDGTTLEVLTQETATMGAELQNLASGSEASGQEAASCEVHGSELLCRGERSITGVNCSVAMQEAARKSGALPPARMDTLPTPPPTRDLDSQEH